MSKHLKKKFKRLWAKEKQQFMEELQHGPADDISIRGDSYYERPPGDIKRNWVDVLGDNVTDMKDRLLKPFPRFKINQSGI